MTAARTEELEAENRKLNAELEEAKQRLRASSSIDGRGVNSRADRLSTIPESETKTENMTVEIEDYNRVKDDLIKLERDYGKLVWARDHLEAKVREQKDSLRQWKDYRKSWILKHPNKRLSHLRPSSARASPSKTAEDHRSSSAPAPPALSEGLTPSLSAVSNSPSPHHNALADLKDLEHRHEQALEYHIRDQQSRSDEPTVSQAGHNIANGSDSGDVTEATPESEGQAEPIKTESATGGSSPVIVFERSVKRRRSTKDIARNIHVHEDHQHRLGATPGTLPPKDERISSPIPAPARLHLDGPHDSLDLDDVGDHLDTPRKRQRIARERLRSSMMVPVTASQDEQNMLEDGMESELPRCLNQEEAESETDKQPSSSAENLWGVHQNSADEKNKARRAEKMARQHAHNDRIHQRLEAAERRDFIFDLPMSSSPTTNELVEHAHNDRVHQRLEAAERGDSIFDLPMSSSPTTNELVQHAHNDRVHQRLEAAERRDIIFDPPMSSSPTTNEPVQHLYTPRDPRGTRQQKPQLTSPVILQPRDVNAFVLPRTSDPFANRKRPCPPSRRDRGAAFVPVIAEDGDGVFSYDDTLKAWKQSKEDRIDLHGPADKEPKAPPTHHRLGALLTKPSPEKSLLISGAPAADVSPDQAWSKKPITRVYHSRSKGPTTPRSFPAKKISLNHGPGYKTADFEPIESTMDRYSKSELAVAKRTTKAPAFRKPLPVEHPSEPRPEHEPLRARPVHRLGLQDFKFNPAHSEYAYHETVRRHDEKKSLSGCTDRHCQRCKGLREYVTNSGYKTAQKPGESEDEADWRLMQEHLGDNRRQLRSMSSKERSDVLIEAKVKEFANRYGCHRQAFSRAREAPGFWDVEFPTTQKEAENRAAADIMEREKVQERYWEATRPKGKWMFADE